MSGGRTVRLFLVDGAPTGIVTAEIMNWTGHVLSAPRTNLSSVLKRPEAPRTGIYILLGDPIDNTGRRQIYIGESDDVGRRVAEHTKDEKKDFYERFIIITSKDYNLTKAHARYLESRLSEIARSNRRVDLENSTAPSGGALPESDLADMEFFIEQLRIVLPVLGVDAFRAPTVIETAAGSSFSKGNVDSQINDTAIELFYPRTKHGYEANGFVKDGILVVRAGSTALRRPEFAERSMANYRELRERLIQTGVLVPHTDDKLLVFSADTEFASPSAAACVIHGGSRNGRYEWRVAATGQRLKEYEAALAEAAE